MGQTTPHSCFIWHAAFFLVLFCFAFLTSLACQYFKQEPFHVSTSIPNPDPLKKWEDLAIVARLSHSCSCWSREAAAGSTHSLHLLLILCPPGLALPVQFLTKPTDIWISILVCSSLLQRKHSELWDRMDAKNTDEAQETEQPACWTFGNRTVTRRSSGAESSKA